LGFADAPTTGLPPSPAPARPAPGKSPLPYFTLVVVVAALVVGLLGYWRARNAGTQPVAGGNSNPGLNTPARELSYSLSVRMKKNADGPPVELPGEIIFQPGDELRVKLTSPQDGFLYIIGEGPQPDPKTGLPQYNLLFPTPSATAQIKANQTVFLPAETGPGFVVDKEIGSEKIWLVWSQSNLNQLEQLRKWYNAQDKGAINDEADTTKVRDFLQSNETARPIAEKDTQQLRLKGRQVDLLIYPIILAHY
jgi:hypothetical protein